MPQAPRKLDKRKLFVSLEHIRSKVTQPIQKENAFFSIIGDEVTDKYANQEVLSVCLKVLRSKK